MAAYSTTIDFKDEVESAIKLLQKIETKDDTDLKTVTMACMSASNAMQEIKRKEIEFFNMQVNAFIPAIPAVTKINQLKDQEQLIKDGMNRINCP